MIELLIHCSTKRGCFNIGAWIIMLAERLPFSHVALELRDGDKFTVCEAVVPKSRVIDGGHWRTQYKSIRVFRFYIPESKRDHVLQWFKKQDGLEYGWGSIVVIALGLICRPFEKVFKSVKVDGAKKKICSELVGRFMRRFFGVDFGERPDTISIRDVLRECLKLERQLKRQGPGVQYGNFWIS